MNANTASIAVKPPRLIPTLIKGFNIVASRVHLILIPIFVDLILWLGPKLRVKDLFLPFINDVTGTISRFGSPEFMETLTTVNAMWMELLERYNLLTAIRTIPIGIPSLMARQSPMSSPLEASTVFETPSLQVAVAVLGIMMIIGFFLGTLYFNSLARFSLPIPEKLDWKLLLFQFAQTLSLFLLLVVLAIFIIVPGVMMVSIFSLISPGLGQFVVLVIAFLIVWLVMPLIFSPHGVFALNQKAFQSMLISVRMVRFFLPGTGLFIVMSVLISEGLNYLWMLPEPENWLTVMGIAGHGFVVTALIAASFLYYRDGLSWMQYNIQKIAEARKQQAGGGSPSEQH